MHKDRQQYKIVQPFNNLVITAYSTYTQRLFINIIFNCR